MYASLRFLRQLIRRDYPLECLQALLSAALFHAILSFGSSGGPANPGLNSMRNAKKGCHSRGKTERDHTATDAIEKVKRRVCR